MGNRFREKATEKRQEEVVEQRAVEMEEKENDVMVEEPESAEEEQHPRTNGKGDKVAKGVAKVLGGDILGDKMVVKQIPLLLLCLFFLLLLVANRYKVESLSREKIASLERINDLREQRIQMQKQYQKSVKISQIAEELRESGVGITSGPPYEIER